MVRLPAMMPSQKIIDDFNKQTTTTAEQRKKGLQKEKEKDSHHLDMADNSTHVPQEAKTQVYVL